MKKQYLSVLIVITCLFSSFTLGFFLGRNKNHETIQISVLPSTNHNLPLETTFPPESFPIQNTFPVDINSAEQEVLCTLPGIGPTIARRILDYRNQNGPFERPEELMNVEGIGAGKLEALLNFITTGG